MAQTDALAAYNAAAGLSYTSDLTGQDLGLVSTLLSPLQPGVYKYDSSAELTGTLYLNGGGASNAVYVFQIGSTLKTAPGSSVVIENPGSNDELIWQVVSSATLDTTTAFEGNIIADQSITLNTGATIGCGSALALNGAVTLDNNTITTGCNGVNGYTPPSTVPEESSTLMLALCLLSLAGGFYLKARHPGLYLKP